MPSMGIGIGGTSGGSMTGSEIVSAIDTQLGSSDWQGGSGAPSVNAQTGTTYTLALGDANNIVTMDNASSNTLSIPTNASVAFPVGTVISVIQQGAGTTTIDGVTGVTVNGVSSGSADISAQYGSVSLVKLATNEWNLVGERGGVT